MTPPSHPTATATDTDADWQSWEEYVERLHEAARAVNEPLPFYEQLLHGAVDAVAALGGAIWRRTADGALELIHQIGFQEVFELPEVAKGQAQRQMMQLAMRVKAPRICPPRGERAALNTPAGNPASTGPEFAENPSSAVLLLCPVRNSMGEASPGFGRNDSTTEPRVQAVVALFQDSNHTPAGQEGGLQFLSTVCLAATDFEAFFAMRALRTRQDKFRQAAGLLQQLSGSQALKPTAYQIVGESRRLLACDRVSVLVPRGHGWQLLAVSGADPIHARADLVRQLSALARRTAHWGEVVEYRENQASSPMEKCNAHRLDATELPSALGEALQRHIDTSHARHLVAVPMVPKRSLLDTSEEELASPSDPRPTAVLVAEQFSVAGSDGKCLSRQAAIDLAALCEPALRRTLHGNRWPVRMGLRVARGSSWLATSLGLRRAGLAAVGLVALVAALVWIPVDLEVAAPASLLPRVRGNLFAPCNGTVKKVLVSHGDVVAAGQVLTLLDDPQLALETQRVRGEIQTVRKQLEAVTAAQTDRSARAQTDRLPAGLPLSAQQQQWTQQLAGLSGQLQILDRRRAALTLHSPMAGRVLTLDVQNLLETRPVRRGDLLFTVANVDAGWILEAELPQDRLGTVLQAAKTSAVSLPVRFRLAGNSRRTYSGHVEQIQATAVLLDTDLTGPAPPIGVRICVDQEALPYGRPGMAAEVRIGCGRRAMGYVWLHDVWETVYRWLVF